MFRARAQISDCFLSCVLMPEAVRRLTEKLESPRSKQTSLLFCGGAAETNGGSQQVIGREGAGSDFLLTVFG